MVSETKDYTTVTATLLSCLALGCAEGRYQSPHMFEKILKALGNLNLQEREKMSEKLLIILNEKNEAEDFLKEAESMLISTETPLQN